MVVTREDGVGPLENEVRPTVGLVKAASMVLIMTS